MFRIFFMVFVMATSLFSASYNDIATSKTVRIGVSPNMPPFSKMDGGKFEGFEIDFAKALIGKIFPDGMSIVFVPVEQADRRGSLTSDKVDILIAAYTSNEERAKEVDFSVPYFSIVLSVTSKKSDKITSEADLRGKKVATIADSNSDIYLKKEGFDVVYCQNNIDCYRKVKSGEAVGFMHNIVSTATIPVIDPEFENSINFVNLFFMDCVAVQKGETELIEKINEGIVALSKEGFFKKKYDETFAPLYRGSLDKKYFILDDVYGAFLF